MPGLPLAVCETKNLGCSCSHSRVANEMCCQQCFVHLTEDEELAAEESFSLYCKPVELYNILQRRAIKSPMFLQRSLLYKIQAIQNKRIHISLFFSASQNTHLQGRSIFPLYVLLARPLTAVAFTEHSPIYSITRAYKLSSFDGLGSRDHAEATFIIPGIERLRIDSRSSNLNIIIISYGESNDHINEIRQREDKIELSSFPGISGECFWGKIPVDALNLSSESCASLHIGHRAEMFLKVNMLRAFVEPKFLEQKSCITFCSQRVDSACNFSLETTIYAQETGGRERTPYSSYSYSDVPASLLPQIMRLRAGNVLFNYKYYNNTLQRTEVTEDFTCPFCLVQCASYKGLRCHLVSSHDLFSYEFWVTEEYQAVNVTVKADSWTSEIVADGIDPRLQTFSYRSKSKKRRQSGNLKPNMSFVHPHNMESDSPDDDAQTLLEDEYLQRGNGLSGASTTNDCAQSLPGGNLSPPPVLQFGKTRKLSAERADPRNRLLLQKRQFYHSHRAQPMALEQVFSDRDSEDEVDDDIADLEDRRMLDDFVDVTKDEKQIMHLWNSFVRKQRVLADGHIPWACEAFSQYHGRDLVQAPKLLWCWRFFLIKLWNHSLLDARCMNTCNTILESFQSENLDHKKS